MAKMLAGITVNNASLFKRVQVPLGDPAAWIELDSGKIAMVRDLEMDRVRQHSDADIVTCPAEHAPASGLSADRETATAQAAAQLLLKAHVSKVTADRTFPFIYAWHLQQAGIEVAYDETLGVLDRRAKSERELEALAAAQRVTEQVMQMMCEIVARSAANAAGVLLFEGDVLTSERKKAASVLTTLSGVAPVPHTATNWLR